MKVRSLFDVIVDGLDLLDFFTDVESVEQLISRLDRLKRKETAEELLACIHGQRASINAALEDTLEMSASLDEDDDEDDDLDREIAKLAADAEPVSAEPPEKQNPAVTPAAEDPKNVVPPGE